MACTLLTLHKDVRDAIWRTYLGERSITTKLLKCTSRAMHRELEEFGSFVLATQLDGCRLSTIESVLPRVTSYSVDWFHWIGLFCNAAITAHTPPIEVQYLRARSPPVPLSDVNLQVSLNWLVSISQYLYSLDIINIILPSDKACDALQSMRSLSQLSVSVAAFCGCTLSPHDWCRRSLPPFVSALRLNTPSFSENVSDVWVPPTTNNLCFGSFFPNELLLARVSHVPHVSVFVSDEVESTAVFPSPSLFVPSAGRIASFDLMFSCYYMSDFYVRGLEFMEAVSAASGRTYEAVVDESRTHVTFAWASHPEEVS